MNKIIIINGPNLNLLGEREPEIYGKVTLKQIEKQCLTKAKELKIKIHFYQSNSEGKIIEKIQEAKNFNGVILNAGAFTHTSIAIHDALKSLQIPKIEVHISNIYNREEFRKKSFISPAVNAILAGFGTNGYAMALKAIVELIKNE